MAYSATQKRTAQMALALRRGKKVPRTPAVVQMAESMSETELEDFIRSPIRKGRRANAADRVIAQAQVLGLPLALDAGTFGRVWRGAHPEQKEHLARIYPGYASQAETPGQVVPPGEFPRGSGVHGEEKSLDGFRDLTPKHGASTRLAYELAPGEGTPNSRLFPQFGDLPYEHQEAVTKDVLDRVVPLVLQELGIKAGLRFYGPGGWEGGFSPSGQQDVRVGEQRARLAMAGVGLLAQQTSVLGLQPHPRGKNIGLRLVDEEKGGPLSDPERAHALFQELAARDPRLDGGFSPTTVHGHRGIALVDDGSYHWTEADLPDFEQAIGDAAEAAGVKLHQDLSGHYPLHRHEVRNDWRTYPNGEAFQTQAASGGRPDLLGGLVNTHRDKTEGWIRDALRRHARVEVGPDGAHIPLDAYPGGIGKGLTEAFERAALSGDPAANGLFERIQKGLEAGDPRALQFERDLQIALGQDPRVDKAEGDPDDPYDEGESPDLEFYAAVPEMDPRNKLGWTHSMDGLQPAEHRKDLARHVREYRALYRAYQSEQDPAERQRIAQAMQVLARHYAEHLNAQYGRKVGNRSPVGV